MQPISEDYQHRALFKSYTGLRYSQNCYEGKGIQIPCFELTKVLTILMLLMIRCYTVPPYGAPQFLQCSSCRAVRFCVSAFTIDDKTS